MDFRPNAATPARAAARVATLDQAHTSQLKGPVSRETAVPCREHLTRAPVLAELGCLAVTAGLAGLMGKERIAVLSRLLETAALCRDFGEMAGIGSESVSQTQRPNLTRLLGVLGIVAALL